MAEPKLTTLNLMRQIVDRNHFFRSNIEPPDPPDPFKYNEQELLDEIREYIRQTYGQHYVEESSGLQIQDMFHSIGIAIPFCQANAIKYLSRYGKKKGENRIDLLKAIHYTILMMHFVDASKPTKVILDKKD